MIAIVLCFEVLPFRSLKYDAFVHRMSQYFLANGDHSPICWMWRIRLWVFPLSFPSNLLQKQSDIPLRKNRMAKRYHRVCIRVCGLRSTFVTLSEYGIFYGTMARKLYVGHWIQCPTCSVRCIWSTIDTSGPRKMNR